MNNVTVNVSPCYKTIVDNEDSVPFCILGYPAYPLQPYLMKEFSIGCNTSAEQFFGYRLSSSRMVTECSFGALKGRYGILRQPLDVSFNDPPHVIFACFVLHN